MQNNPERKTIRSALKILPMEQPSQSSDLNPTEN